MLSYFKNKIKMLHIAHIQTDAIETQLAMVVAISVLDLVVAFSRAHAHSAFFQV